MIDAKRVKELREWVNKKAEAIAPNNTFYNPKMWMICKDLLAVLDDYETIQPLIDMADDLIERNMKLEVELEHQRPLIEAAKDVVFINGEPTSLHDGADKRLFRAALKLREEKGK